MKNKNYLILYIISIGINTINIIQTGHALSTGMFIELNPLGYNWFRIFLLFLLYLFLSTVFFVDTKSYKNVFSIGMVYVIYLGFVCFVHDFIVINICV